MATAYKVVPISSEQEGQERHGGDGRAPEPVDARQPAARSWGSTSRGRSPPRRTCMAAIERLYAGNQESIQDVVKQIETDKGLAAVRQPQREHDRPRGDRGDGRGRAGPQAPEHGAAAGDQGQGLGHPLRAVRGRVQDAVPGRRRALRDGPAAPPPGRRPSPAASRSCPTSTSPSGGCRRTAGSSSNVGGNPVDIRVIDPADDVRRERGPAGPRPHGRPARPRTRSACPRTCWPRFREVIHKPNGIVLVTGPTVARARRPRSTPRSTS